ncbi:3908_t:CDS:2 [Ambispora gerdemannii]|uniref:3908_t:CDS:1 n=1 Tax=Ambispora gerdemannii TaxID=144530 RepID=A0A9N9DB01_9GLOM|nr:3908_t:CDS:2 [Ambispora gerdemannii]
MSNTPPNFGYLTTHPLSFSQTRTKYGRLRTKDGHYIGSKWIRRNKDWSRINYTVMIKIEVDIYANYPKRPSVFEVQDFYAICKDITRFDAHEFIDASAIDHCVDFIEIDRLFYIVDKESSKDDINQSEHYSDAGYGIRNFTVTGTINITFYPVFENEFFYRSPFRSAIVYAVINEGPGKKITLIGWSMGTATSALYLGNFGQINGFVTLWQSRKSKS